MEASTHVKPGAGFPARLVGEVLDAALALPQAVPVFGLAGLQGSGKSTLAAQVAALARQRGLQVAVLSLDDFYLDQARRQRLASQVHPLLATRGPPGTHDLDLALRTLDGLVQGRPIALPRFDKLSDQPLDRGQWPLVERRCNLVLLEGWCLGVPAQSAQELEAPINALERSDDAHAVWRTWCNRRLAEDYPALWARINALWFLQGPGFEAVPEWRWQQEQALSVRDPSHRRMDRGQVERFVQLFERVSRQALLALPELADRTLRLDARRHPLPSS